MFDSKRKLAEFDRDELNNIFKKNQVSFILLAPDNGFTIHRDDLLTEYCNSEYLPPQFLTNEVSIRIENLKGRSKTDGFEFFDDVLGRLDDAAMHGNKLRLCFSKTTYFHFAAMNRDLDLPLYTNPATTLRDCLDENPFNLHSSLLPNPLGVVTSLVLEPEKKIVLSIHSDKTLEASGKIVVAIAGSLSIRAGDLGGSGSPDPFNTVIREAKEELGIRINMSDIRFFGLGRDIVTLKPQLIGEIRLNIKEKEFLQLRKDQATDEWESERSFIKVREEVPEYLRMKNWSAPAWASTFLSLTSLNT